MKHYKALFTLIIGAFVITQSANAQEYDDLYFSSKDRIKVRSKNGGTKTPEKVSSKFYYAEPLSEEVSETPVVSSKFSNPDFQSSGTEVLDETELSYFEAPQQSQFDFVNPRPGQNSFNNLNNWNTASNVGFAMGAANGFDPFFGNGFYDPFWDGIGPVSAFGAGWGPDYWALSPTQRWRLRNSLRWGWGMPTTSFNIGFGVGFGWNRWNRWNNPWRGGLFNSWGNPWIGNAWGNPWVGNAWCPPGFGNNVFVVNNRFIGGERFGRSVYRGPITRRSSVGIQPVGTNRSVSNANNQRAAMNRRYADALNKRRTSAPNNGRVSNTERNTRRTPNTVSNPNRYRRSSPSYSSRSSRGSSSSGNTYQRPTRRSGSFGSGSSNRRSNGFNSGRSSSSRSSGSFNSGRSSSSRSSGGRSSSSRSSGGRRR